MGRRLASRRRPGRPSSTLRPCQFGSRPRLSTTTTTTVTGSMVMRPYHQGCRPRCRRRLRTQGLSGRGSSWTRSLPCRLRAQGRGPRAASRARGRVRRLRHPMLNSRESLDRCRIRQRGRTTAAVASRPSSRATCARPRLSPNDAHPALHPPPAPAAPATLPPGLRRPPRRDRAPLRRVLGR